MAKKPLLAAMKKYRLDHVYPLHTPGHKGGRGADPDLRSLMGTKALEADVSLMEELDDIHHPEGCILDAERMAAALYGSDRCFLGVNGTTGLIHGMLLGSLLPGDKILVPRNSHRSVLGGLILAGLRPVYLMPDWDPEWRLLLQVTPEQVATALDADPDIRAVFLTTPNYFGLAADTEAIARVAHQHGALLLVDEAHGPHLGFSDRLPESAMECGADAAAQSTHKITGAMTQCSLLQVSYRRIRPESMEKAMSLVTTTSPNYLLMGSLDAARAQLAERGHEMAEESLHAAQILRNELKKIPQLPVLSDQLIGKGGVKAVDGGKVTILTGPLGLTGPEAADALRAEGIAVELVDEDHVLFLVTYADDREAFVRVAERIRQVLERNRRPERVLVPSEPYRTLPRQRMAPREAFFAPHHPVPFEEAEGRVCGESISFYPPGIPLIMPGEEIDGALLHFCRRMQERGLKVSGPRDVSLQQIEVIEE
jgi:arginine decarboxylase